MKLFDDFPEGLYVDERREKSILQLLPLRVCQLEKFALRHARF